MRWHLVSSEVLAFRNDAINSRAVFEDKQLEGVVCNTFQDVADLVGLGRRAVDLGAERARPVCTQSMARWPSGHESRVLAWWPDDLHWAHQTISLLFRAGIPAEQLISMGLKPEAHCSLQAENNFG